MSVIQSERDVVKYFAMSSVGVRPEASTIIFQRLSKIPLSDHKKAYLDKMLKRIKEKQQLLVHNTSALGNTTGQIILDQDMTIGIL